MNGDWTKSVVQHYCVDAACCQNFSRSCAIAKITSLLAEAFISPISTRLPAQNRWYTFAPALCAEGGGFLCHRILPRVIRRAWKPEELRENDAAAAADDPDREQSTWKVYTGKKLRKAVAFVQEPDTPQTLSVSLLTTQPLDFLSARLQHLDATSTARGELAAKNGLLLQCQQSLWLLLNAWKDSQTAECFTAVLSDLRATQGDHFDFEAMLAEFYRATLEVGSAVWARLEVRFTSWPWKLITGLWPPRYGFSAAEALQVHLDFWSECECCLDGWFSLWLRRKLTCAADLKLPHFQMLIEALAKHITATNMLLESLLSQVKRCLPRGSGSPNSEKQVYLGLLAQLMQAHLEAGRSDSRSAMQRVPKGVEHLPLDRRPSKAWSRADIRWKGPFMAWRRSNPHASQEEADSRMEEFKQAADAERVADLGAALDLDDSLVDLDDADGLEWPMGSDSWPVSEDTMAAFLSQYDDPADRARTRGIAAKASEIRWAQLAELLVRDVGLVAKDQVFTHKFSCSEAHPQLCATRDSNIYSNALDFARRCERYFTVGRRYSFFYIGGQVGGEADFALDKKGICVYYSHKRERRLHAQTTHIFVPVVHHLDNTVSLEQRKGGGAYLFLSAWGLARHLLLMGVEVANVIECKHEPDTHGCWKVIPASTSTSLWPVLEKEPSVPSGGKRHDGLAACDGPPAPKKARVTQGSAGELPGVRPHRRPQGGAREVELQDDQVVGSSDEDDKSAEPPHRADDGNGVPPLAADDGAAPAQLALAEAGAGQGGGDSAGVPRGEAWPRWHMPGGYQFVYNPVRLSLSIHCPHHELCRLNRTCQSGRNPHQGRCIGFLWAWAEAGAREDIVTQKDHMQVSMNYGSPVGREILTCSVRQQARRRAHDAQGSDSLFAKERARREGEESEPEGFC